KDGQRVDLTFWPTSAIDAYRDLISAIGKDTHFEQDFSGSVYGEMCIRNATGGKPVQIQGSVPFKPKDAAKLEDPNQAFREEVSMKLLGQHFNPAKDREQVQGRKQDTGQSTGRY
ncbi:MAG: hypothetical protein IT567_06710, partial [Alphaproteobacteria bacterium]|nr:hypothetical protein [Alphaproteobacteria bacterium]